MGITVGRLLALGGDASFVVTATALTGSRADSSDVDSVADVDTGSVSDALDDLDDSNI